MLLLIQDVIDVEEFIIDIYNHFVNSQPRKLELQEFCEFVSTDYKTVLKHVTTRWLSLERVLSRVMDLFGPLKSYFSSTGESFPSLTLHTVSQSDQVYIAV